MPLHGDERRLSYEIGSNVRAGGAIGYLTDTNVAAADTNAGLQTAVDTKVSGNTIHGEYRPGAQRIKRAIDAGNSATFSMQDADILGLTTVEGLADLTQNTDGAAAISNFFLD